MPKVVYYHTNWSTYGRNFQVKDIPKEVTDISYAFWNVNTDGSIITGDAWADYDKRYLTDSVNPPDTWNDATGMFGNFGQFQKLKNTGRQLDITLSIGGWTWSKNFSAAVSTEATRTRMCQDLLSIFKKFPIFRGVSIDWEYISNDGVNYGNAGNLVDPKDSDNMILLLKQLKSVFNGQYTIAMCCTAAPEKAQFDVESMHPYLDELHVMTYDFHDGSWGETVAAHHTNPRKSSAGVYSCEEAADYYLSRGVPSTKIFIGAAFYSRGYANCEGFGKAASGGSPNMSWETGVVDYKALPIAGATEYIDPESKGAYSYDPVRKILNTYDNVDSVVEKCKIVQEKNLGGILVWENSADKPINDPRSLVKAMANCFAGTYTPTVPTPIEPTVPSTPTEPITPAEPTVPSIPTEPTIPITPSPSVPVEPVAPTPTVPLRPWLVNTSYKVSDRVIYQGIVYMCLTPHKSIYSWEPSIHTQSIWKEIDVENGGNGNGTEKCNCCPKCKC